MGASVPKRTSDYCITFNNNNDYVCGFVDLDFVGDLDKRMSTSGYVFTLAGGAISWMSKFQETFALSTTEDEYIAASHACKEMIVIADFTTPGESHFVWPSPIPLQTP